MIVISIIFLSLSACTQASSKTPTIKIPITILSPQLARQSFIQTTFIDFFDQIIVLKRTIDNTEDWLAFQFFSLPKDNINNYDGKYKCWLHCNLKILDSNELGYTKTLPSITTIQSGASIEEQGTFRVINQTTTHITIKTGNNTLTLQIPFKNQINDAYILTQMENNIDISYIFSYKKANNAIIPKPFNLKWNTSNLPLSTIPNSTATKTGYLSASNIIIVNEHLNNAKQFIKSIIIETTDNNYNQDIEIHIDAWSFHNWISNGWEHPIFGFGSALNLSPQDSINILGFCLPATAYFPKFAGIAFNTDRNIFKKVRFNGIQTDLFYNVLIHECLHALGLAWGNERWNALIDSTTPLYNNGGKITISSAIKAYKEILSSANLDSSGIIAIPIQSRVSAHWAEGWTHRPIDITYNNIYYPALTYEILTPYDNSEDILGNILSKLTVGFLEDYGYKVNYRSPSIKKYPPEYILPKTFITGSSLNTNGSSSWGSVINILNNLTQITWSTGSTYWVEQYNHSGEKGIIKLTVDNSSINTITINASGNGYDPSKYFFLRNTSTNLLILNNNQKQTFEFSDNILVIIDETPSLLSFNIDISKNSTYKDSSHVTVGDIITCELSADQSIQTPQVHFYLAEQTNDIRKISMVGDKTIWSGEYTIKSSDFNIVDNSNIKFVCGIWNFKNNNKLYDHNSLVTSFSIKNILVDTTKPTIYNISFTSNNIYDQQMADVDNTIALTFSTSEPVQKLNIIFLLNNNPHFQLFNYHSYNNPIDISWNVPNNETTGDLSYQVDFIDLAGNIGDTVISNTIIHIDTAPPRFYDISVKESTTFNGETLKFTTNKELLNGGSIQWISSGSTIDASYNLPGAAQISNIGNNTWIYDLSGVDIASNLTNNNIYSMKLSGQNLLHREGTYTITNITIDKIPPVSFTHITIYSNNSNPLYAAAGDIITASFVINESTNTPQVRFKSNTVILDNNSTNINGYNTHWEATYMIHNNDPHGTVSIIITATDKAENVTDLSSTSNITIQ